MNQDTPENRVGRSLLIFLLSVFVVMTGYGITLPVLTFYMERLALAGGASSARAAIHVGALTGVFALMQFFSAPLWGRWSDRVGRRPLILIGLSGYALTNLLFGVGKTLWILYVARILGGALSAAILPAAAAYITDVTSGAERSRGMAWLGSAISLGVVVGPAMGAWLVRPEPRWAYTAGFFSVDAFSLPFFVAALLGVLAWLAAFWGVAESRLRDRRQSDTRSRAGKRGWLAGEAVGLLLVLSLVGQFALTLFEGTFALHGRRVLQLGAEQMGWVFVVCGLVMALVQATLVGWAIRRMQPAALVAIGFGVTAVGLVGLMTASGLELTLLYVAVFATGIGLLSPNLAAMVSRAAGRCSGAALGLQSAANSLGQALGPSVGGLLLTWSVHLPYLLTAVVLLAAAVLVRRQKWSVPAAVHI